ncbi:MAG: GNAT family acetyltransferase [Candidatus Limivivens sp.]|nr:GNAT family acetyltransferase [Candidatus Limivivens sp.]
MIEIKAIMSLPFLKKERFTGSYHGMQYRLEKTGDELKATVFPGPCCFDKTSEEKKTSALFPFDGDGLDQAIAWLNQKYEEKSEEWKAGEKLM